MDKEIICDFCGHRIMTKSDLIIAHFPGLLGYGKYHKKCYGSVAKLEGAKVSEPMNRRATKINILIWHVIATLVIIFLPFFRPFGIAALVVLFLIYDLRLIAAWTTVEKYLN